MTYYLKDPASRVDYAIDWHMAQLGGESIVSSAWAVEPDEPDGLTVEQASHEAARCVARLSGGIAGHVYSVANQVALSNGTLDRRAIHLRVEAR